MKNETFSRQFSESIKDKVVKQIIGEVSQLLEQDPKMGLANYSKNFLERINVETDFKRDGDKNFEKNRESLQREAGLIIANHPSIADGPLLLQMIEREDLKIVVKPELFEKSAGTTFQEKLIPAYSDGLRAPKSIRKIIAHIKSGGVVLIFPTGGNEIKTKTKEFNFREGFRVILQKLPDDSMVYCFNIDMGENRHLSSKGQFQIHTALDFLSGFSMPVSAFNNTSTICIDERYTTAQDWKSATRDSAKGQETKFLLEYYKKIFGVE
jgi:hypothetical protein